MLPLLSDTKNISSYSLPFITCRCRQCFILFCWIQRFLRVWGWNFDTLNACQVLCTVFVFLLFPLLLISLPLLLLFLIPFLSPSLYFGMIVRVCSTALSVKVINQHFFFFLDNLYFRCIILLFLARNWCWPRLRWVPRRTRNFW